MAYLKQSNPAFWNSIPEELKHIQEKRANPDSKVAYFLMGALADNPTTISAIHMPPGYVLPRHAHECHRFEIVAKGSLEVDGKTLIPGDVMFSAPFEFYGPHTAGPEGCDTFEIFEDFQGSHTLILDLPDGPKKIDIKDRDVWFGGDNLFRSLNAPKTA